MAQLKDIQIGQFKEERHFSELAKGIQRFADILKNYSIPARCQISKEAEDRFNSYAEAHQLGIIAGLGGYTSLLEEIYRKGVSLIDNRQLTWQALSFLKFRPRHDLLDSIEDDDVVEIYTKERIQVFRNLKFFELCSYTIADILIYDWPNLYERDIGLTDELLSFSDHIFLPNSVTQPFNFRPHQMREIFSEEKRCFEIKDGYISPLWDRNSPLVKSLDGELPVAFLATKKVKILSSSNFA